MPPSAKTASSVPPRRLDKYSVCKRILVSKLINQVPRIAQQGEVGIPLVVVRLVRTLLFSSTSEPLSSTPLLVVVAAGTAPAASGGGEGVQGDVGRLTGAAAAASQMERNGGRGMKGCGGSSPLLHTRKKVCRCRRVLMWGMGERCRCFWNAPRVFLVAVWGSLTEMWVLTLPAESLALTSSALGDPPSVNVIRASLVIHGPAANKDK